MYATSRSCIVISFKNDCLLNILKRTSLISLIIFSHEIKPMMLHYMNSVIGNIFYFKKTNSTFIINLKIKFSKCIKCLL